MAQKTFTITNKSNTTRVLAGITFAPRQMRSGVRLEEGYARTLHARGGAWHIGGSMGGAGKRVQVREETGDAGGTETAQQQAKALLDRREDMPWEDFREAAKAFLGDRALPRGKGQLVAALEEFAST